MPDLQDEEQAPQSDHEWAKLRREARDAATKAAEQEARAAAAERGLAMARAGVDVNDPRFKYFDKGFDGELHPEAIKAEWQLFAGTQQSTPVDLSQQADAQAMNRIQAAADGGSVQPAGDQNPRAGMEDRIREETAGLRDSKMVEEIALRVMRESGVQFSE